MRRITMIISFMILTMGLKAGVILGYQAGYYTRGIANIQSTTYYYNNVFDANFKYRNMFHGVYLGYRFELDNGWFGLAWHNKHNSYTSEYIDNKGVTKQFGIKHRMNDLVFDIGYRGKKFGIGGGFDMANYNVFTKRGTPEEYKSAKWGYNDYGIPIKFIGLPTFPSFSIEGECYLGKLAILRATYQFGLGENTFANDGRLMFWDFYGNNLTFSLLFNFSSKK